MFLRLNVGKMRSRIRRILGRPRRRGIPTHLRPFSQKSHIHSSLPPEPKHGTSTVASEKQSLGELIREFDLDEATIEALTVLGNIPRRHAEAWHPPDDVRLDQYGGPILTERDWELRDGLG